MSIRQLRAACVLVSATFMGMTILLDRKHWLATLVSWSVGVGVAALWEYAHGHRRWLCRLGRHRWDWLSYPEWVPLCLNGNPDVDAPDVYWHSHYVNIQHCRVCKRWRRQRGIPADLNEWRAWQRALDTDG